MLDLAELLERGAADPLGRRVGRDELRVAPPRSRAARAAGRRTRGRRSPGRRGRSSGGRGGRSGAAAPPRASSPWRVRPCSPPRGGPGGGSAIAVGRHRLRARLASIPSKSQPCSRSRPGRSVRSKCTGVTEIRPLCDRGEVGALLVLERGLEAVDLVAAPAPVLLLLDQLQLVVVEPLAEVGHLDPARLAGGAVDVEQRVGGKRILCRPGAPAPPRRPPPRRSRTRARSGSPSRCAADCWEIAIAGMPEDDPLERGRDRPRVGDVVARGWRRG